MKYPFIQRLMQSSGRQAKNGVPLNMISGFGVYGSSYQMSTMISHHNPFQVLRRTNRLQEYLKLMGCGFYEPSIYPADTLFDIREVEFIPPREEPEAPREYQEECTALGSPSFVPAGFSFWTLERLIKRKQNNPKLVPLGYRPNQQWGDHIPRSQNWWLEDQSINIFWLSPTELVTPLWLDGYEYHESYVVDFSFNEKCSWSSKHSSLRLYGYHIKNINKNGHEITPEAPPQFFKHLVAPVVDRISSIAFRQRRYSRSTSRVLEILSHVPTNDLGHSTLLDQKNDVLRLSLDLSMTDEQFQELLSFPFHPNVRLGLAGLSLKRYNRLLLQAEYLRHFLISHDMLAINCEGKIFGSHRPFQSLTFCVKDELPSHQLMEFIAKNSTIGSLAVQCSSGSYYHKSHCRILDMLRSPCVGRNSSVKQFTIELYVQSCERRSEIMRDAQDFFDRWCDICFDWNKGFAQHSGLSSFRFAISDGRYKPLIKSNPQWDAFVVPSLALNWYDHQQPTESSPSALDEICIMEWAVRAVNQGIAFRGATSVVPCDQSTSSASLIFYMLRGKWAQSRKSSH
jgi:hypothetical protein